MNNIVKEGDIYKILTVFGKTFELRYGYYTERERHSKFNEVVPIYPDFLKSPFHTSEGHPFVTQMQDICSYYKGGKDGDDCYSCEYYLHGEELLGICTCEKNRKNEPTAAFNENFITSEELQ